MDTEKQKKKILIIEDDEHISRIYEAKFSQEGVETVVVQSGEEAVASVRKEEPNLIILDIMLPKKDGFMILEEIKQDSKLASIPVLVISNLGQESDKERAFELGAKEYMVKVEYPVQEVIDKIKEYLY